MHAARFHGTGLSHRDTFFASLICNVPVGCRLLTCFDDEDGAVFSWVRCAAVTAMSSCPPSASTYPAARFTLCKLPCLPPEVWSTCALGSASEPSWQCCIKQLNPFLKRSLKLLLGASGTARARQQLRATASRRSRGARSRS